MNRIAGAGTAASPWSAIRRPSTGTFVMAALILTFGFYILYPVVLIFVNSFNIASIVDPYKFSFQNWQLEYLPKANHSAACRAFGWVVSHRSTRASSLQGL